MAIIRVTKEFEFEMAHALHNYDGKCKNMHGHSYKLSVTVKGTPVNDDNHPKNGMIIDFGDLKKIIKTHIVDIYDHAVVFSHNETFQPTNKTIFGNCYYLPYQPTCENMVADFAHIIIKYLPENVSLHSIKLHETSSSYAEWYADDNA